MMSMLDHQGKAVASRSAQYPTENVKIDKALESAVNLVNSGAGRTVVDHGCEPIARNLLTENEL